MGIELASQVINCLLFADDIVLGKSETELQALLNIRQTRSNAFDKSRKAR
jgi:hypothetical protein